MPEHIIVSSSDSKYFPMLAELVHSIRRFPQSIDFDIGILNAGLNAEQCVYFQQQGCIVKDPQWPEGLSTKRAGGREFLKACVSRPFLPDYFPGYQTILWMDADLWVQDWSAIDLYLKGAARGALTIVPESDRAYPKSSRLSWLGPLPFKPKGFYYNNARLAFDGKMARRLYPYVTANAGIFSMSADAPHWKRWQELILQALKKGNIFTAEQLTLGVLIYLENYRAEFLPTWCNWRCGTLPAWDETSQKLVVPYLPHETIGIIHMTGMDRERLDRRLLNTLVSPDRAKTYEKSLRCPIINGEEVLSV